MHLDLKRSLKRNGESYEFGPIAHIVRKEDEATITGVVTDTSVVLVCAYLQRKPDFNGGEFKRLPKGRKERDSAMMLQRGELREKRRPGDPLEGRFEANVPPSFEPTASSIDFDTDGSCSKAFATADVANGAFRLGHIWPGKYALRFYNQSGAVRDDLLQRVDVKPGETVKVSQP